MPSKSGKHEIPKGYEKLAGSARPRSSGAKLLGPLDANEVVAVTLVLRHKPGSPALPDHQHWQDTPLAQRRFLSPKEYAESYGASQADADAVIAFAASHGLTVIDSHLGRRTVDISGTAAQMNAAFGIALNRYESPRPAHKPRSKAGAEDRTHATHVHRGYDGDLHIPSELGAIVTAVIGFDNRALGGPGGSSG